MSTSTSAQNILTIIKDEFTEVITEGTLSPTVKPNDWNAVITEKALLNAMRTPSPLPEETQRGLTTLYDNTFPTLKDYREYTVNRLVMWGNTMEYKLFNLLYVNHRNNTRTVKKLREQAMALLEEANKINDRDLVVRQELENHVETITRANLRQCIRKPQRVRIITSPTPLPGPSRYTDNSHQATYSRKYTHPQYQCFQCGDLTHFKWDCPLYTCRTCDQVAPGHAPKACKGRTYDDGIRGYYGIDRYDDENLTGEC
jgi:hypothetical protein